MGVLLSGVFFAFKVSRLLTVTRTEDADTVTYTVRGQVFFASADLLLDSFDVRDLLGRAVRIDLSDAHLWDITAVKALEKVRERVGKYASGVEVVGLNAHSKGLANASASSIG